MSYMTESELICSHALIAHIFPKTVMTLPNSLQMTNPDR